MVESKQKAPVLAEKFKEEQLILNVTPQIQAHIGDEVFISSCQIVKYGEYGFRNTRNLVIT